MTQNNYPKVTALARTFPTFARDGQKSDAPGLEPFDADKFDAWLNQSGCSHGEYVAGQFVLQVFNPQATWQSGRFDLMDALGVWDDKHRVAFSLWIDNPWWP